MKRLFCVKDVKGRLIKLGTFGAKTEPDFTDSKEHAKDVRDEVGGVEHGYHVSLGPDHKNYGDKGRKTHFGSKDGRRGDGFKQRK